MLSLLPVTRNSVCLLAAMLAIAPALPALASGSNTLIDQWYDALRNGDKAAIETLLMPSAVIELRDLGISQTGSEFVDSFDEWLDVNEGAEILVRPAAGITGAYEVCYRFAANEVLMRESFSLSGERISGSVQEEIATGCGTF